MSAPIRQEEAQSFLLLGLGFALNSSFPKTEKIRRPPHVVSTINVLRAEVRPVLLVENRGTLRRDVRYGSENGRLLVVSKRKKNAQSDVEKIAEALQALISVQQGWPTSHGVQPYAIPDFVCKRGRILLADIEKLNRDLGSYSDLLEGSIKQRLRSHATFSESVTAYALFHLPALIRRRELFDATHYYQECISDYIFEGDSITETLNKPELVARNERVRVQLESALLNSFRAIEALVGEPGNNESRFEGRLRAVGVDPKEPVGFTGDEPNPISERIRFVHALRDQTSAHGRRRRSEPLRFKEVMEAQHLAQCIVLEALFHLTSRDGRAGGTNAERRYLLEAMFGRAAVNSAQESIGERPELLVTRSGGLETIWNSIQLGK